MGNFQGSKGGYKGNSGKPSFPKKAWSGDRNDREVTMHRATCSDCSKVCEVPFRPTGEKPVFCNECFNGKRDSSDSRGSKDFGGRAPREFNDRHAPRNDFRSSERPAFRPETRSEKQAFNPGNDETKKQLAEIGVKLDRLINAMEKMTALKAPVSTVAQVSQVSTVAKAPKVLAKVSPKPEVKKATPKAPAKVIAKVAVKKVVVSKAPTKVVAKKKK